MADEALARAACLPFLNNAPRWNVELEVARPCSPVGRELHAQVPQHIDLPPPLDTIPLRGSAAWALRSVDPNKQQQGDRWRLGEWMRCALHQFPERLDLLQALYTAARARADADQPLGGALYAEMRKHTYD